MTDYNWLARLANWLANPANWFGVFRFVVLRVLCLGVGVVNYRFFVCVVRVMFASFA